MAVFRLSYLELEGFRSFAERQRVEFPEKGMILISGKYKGSLVSSGSGKSSIIEAIAFALDIGNIPATELKCWYSKSLYVKLGITDGTNLIEIERNPKLNLIINGESWSELSGGSKEKLYNLLGLSPEILAQVSYRQQREKGVFLNSTDSELKKFLTKTLKLESIETEAEKFNKKASSLELTISALKRDIGNYENLLPSMAVSDETLEEARKQVKIAAQKILSLSKNDTSEIQSEIEKCNIYLREISIKSGNISGEIAKLNALKINLTSAKNQNVQIRESVVSHNAELDKLRHNICHTCEKPLESDKLKNLISNKQIQIDSLFEKMKTNIEYIKNAETAISSIDSLEKEKMDLLLGQQEVEGRKNELLKKIGEMNAPISLAMQAKGSADSNYNAILSKKESYNAVLSKINNAKEELSKNEKEYLTNFYSGKVLGRNGFLAFIFEETLVGIQNRTNEMIKNIPNIESFNLEISTTKTTKTTKSTKEEIKKAILKSGFEVSFKSMSGGQQAGMELCSDLAVAKEIKQKSGAGIGWIMLDEAMDGLGTTEKQAALEIIKEKFDGQIIIIDHATEIKEAFTQVIEVEYDGKFSQIN